MLSALDNAGCPDIKTLGIDPNLGRLDNALEISPDCVPCLTLRATLHYELADNGQDASHAEKAASDVAAALKLDPANPDAKVEDCRLRNFQLRMALQTDAAFEEALASCNAALKVGTNTVDPRTYLTLGFIYEQRCDAEAAIANQHKAIALRPEEVKARINLVSLLLDSNRLPQAERRARELIGLLKGRPDDEESKQALAPAYLHLGFTLLGRHQYQDAGHAFHASAEELHLGKNPERDEAAAIRGEMRVRTLTGQGQPNMVRLKELTSKLPQRGSGAFEDLLLVFSRADPPYARTLLDRLPADGSCSTAITRAQVLHNVGDDQAARADLQQCQPSQDFERRCKDELSRWLEP